jgi:ADP-heptose:LPS heptosyltransferase
MLNKSNLEKIEKRIRSQSCKLRFKWNLEKAFHFIIFPLILLLKSFVCGKNLKERYKILVVARILRIGDILTLQPAIRTIRNKYPKSRIDILVDEPLIDFAKKVLDVDKAIGFDKERSLTEYMRFLFRLRRENYSKSYIFVSDFLSILSSLLIGIPERIAYNFNMRGHPASRYVSPPPTMNRPGFLYPEGYEDIHITELWQRLVSDKRNDIKIEINPEQFRTLPDILKNRDYIVIHPSTDETSYLWITERWIEIAKRIVDRGYEVVITGGPDDTELASEISNGVNRSVINLSGKTDLSQYISVLAYSKLVVTLDTSAGHIGAGFNKPVVVLFGPGDEVIWQPYGDRVTVVRGDSTCNMCKKPQCFQDKHYCMQSIETDCVWQTILPYIH